VRTIRARQEARARARGQPVIRRVEAEPVPRVWPRSEEETERVLHERDTRTDFPEPKVDLRRSVNREPPPGWNRMTAVQRRLYNEDYHVRWTKKMVAKGHTWVLRE